MSLQLSDGESQKSQRGSPSNYSTSDGNVQGFGQLADAIQSTNPTQKSANDSEAGSLRQWNNCPYLREAGEEADSRTNYAAQERQK